MYSHAGHKPPEHMHTHTHLHIILIGQQAKPSASSLERALSVGVLVSFDNKDSVRLWRAVHQSVKLAQSLFMSAEGYVCEGFSSNWSHSYTSLLTFLIFCLLFVFSLENRLSPFAGNCSPVGLLSTYAVYLH